MHFSGFVFPLRHWNHTFAYMPTGILSCGLWQVYIQRVFLLVQYLSQLTSKREKNLYRGITIHIIIYEYFTINKLAVTDISHKQKLHEDQEENHLPNCN